MSSTEREVFIRFNGITHFRIDRRELVGLQSWSVNRGRVNATYAIQIYTRSSAQEVTLEYDSIDKWTEVLRQLDGVPFLNEWKVQDP
ncbi:hypothetical protein ACRAVF_18960 [Bradyrhizobium oligotrophicum S58]